MPRRVQLFCEKPFLILNIASNRGAYFLKSIITHRFVCLKHVMCLLIGKNALRCSGIACSVECGSVVRFKIYICTLVKLLNGTIPSDGFIQKRESSHYTCIFHMYNIINLHIHNYVQFLCVTGFVLTLFWCIKMYISLSAIYIIIKEIDT